MIKKTSQEISQGLLRAIDILVDRGVGQAKFDRTIPVQIVKCIDSTTGTYRVKHQDATYTVTSGDTDVQYEEGDEVYVLVPEGDMSNEKKIVGEVRAATTTHTVKDTDILANYQNIGENIISSTGEEFGLCSYKWIDEAQTIHDYKVLYEHEKDSLLSLDNDMFIKILEEEGCDHFGIEATFRTDLNPEQRDRGNYGLKVYLIYETDSGEEQKHEFIIDANIMIGNPYLFVDGSIQNVMYELPQGKFKRVDSIIFFSDAFVHKEASIEDLDIFVKNIKIHGMAQTNAPYFNTYTLELNFSTGNVLSKTNPSTIVSPTVLYHGESTDNSNFEFYWFRANSEITSSHDNFSQIGGVAWECLNSFRLAAIEGSEDKKKTWISQENFTITRNADYAAQQTKYKCVIKLDNGSVLEKIFYIADNDATHAITLSATEKSFKNSAGCATITCDVIADDKDKFKSLIYCWHKINSAGVPIKLNNPDEITNGEGLALSDKTSNYLIQLTLNDLKNFIQNGIKNKYFNYETYFGKLNISESHDDYKEVKDIFNSITSQYNEAYSKYLEDVLKNLLDIDSSTALVDANVSYQDVLTQLIDIDERYYITYICENLYHELPARIFSGSVDYGCTVWAEDVNKNRVYLGSANLALTNIIDSSASTATLNIIGGDQVFKYDIMGRSPILKTDDNPQPQIVQSLTFNLFDDKGVQIDNGKIYDGPGSIVSGWEWQVPANNTFIKLSEKLGSTLSEDGSFYIIKNLKELPFTLVSTYSNSYSNNKIRLNVNYQGTIVRAYTNFIFTKDGSNGTNGTEYVCKVSPNVNGGLEEYPSLIFDIAQGNSKLNYTPEEDGKWFKAELWRNSEIVTPEADENLFTSWKILTNKYQYQDEKGAAVGDTADNLYYSYDSVNDTFTAILDNYDKLEHPSLITQAEIKYTIKNNDSTSVDGTTITDSKVNTQTQTIYGALPLSTILLYNNSYKVRINPASGFNQVIFDADGKRPSYSNKDFEVQVFSNENLNDNIADSFTFEFEAYGFSNLLQVKALEEAAGVCLVKVKEGYNGYDTNIGLKCTIKKEDEKIGVIYHPIYFMLNRYGLSALNGWNGNSIEVNEEKTVLLAPQIGAGYKEDDNSFTGMIMGTLRKEVTEEVTGSSLKDKTGLLGFKAGKQSLFLDAETGRAEFGFAGSGQIILDPGYSEVDHKFNANARIYGGDYKESSTEGTGLLIDLTTPEIKYGSGKFKVDKDGNLNAQDAVINGDIIAKKLTIINSNGEEEDINDALNSTGGVPAAFEEKVAKKLSGGKSVTIDDSSVISPYIGGGYLYITDNGKKSVTIDPADEGKTGYIFRVTGNDGDTVKIDSNGSATFSGTVYANAGEFTGKVIATSGEFTGKVTATSGSFSGDITANTITATNTGNIAGWTFESGKFYSKNGSAYSTMNNASDSDIVFSAGGSDYNGTNAKFKVDRSGKLYAKEAEIEGPIKATKGGTLANWTIDTNRIYSGDSNAYTIIQNAAAYNNVFMAGAASVSDSAAANFKVDKNGKLYATGAEISGYINASDGGKIGGFNIDSTTLRSTGTQDNAAIIRIDYDYDYTANLNGNNEDINVNGYIRLGSRTSSNSDFLTPGLMIRGNRKFKDSSAEQIYDSTDQIILLGPTYQSAGNCMLAIYPVGSPNNYLGFSHDSICHSTNNISIRPKYDQSSVGSVDISGSLRIQDHLAIWQNDSGNLVFGYNKNTGPTSLRSGAGVWIQCNGSSAINDDVDKYSIRFVVDSNGNSYFRPASKGLVNLGSSDHCWQDIYSKDGTVSKSDRNLKENINIINDNYLNLFDSLQPVSYNFKDGKRIHLGFISQDVEDALFQNNLTAMDFAGFCKDKNEEDDNYHYSLRYSEFIALNTAKIKQLEEKIKEQQIQINLLLSKLDS